MQILQLRLMDLHCPEPNDYVGKLRRRVTSRALTYHMHFNRKARTLQHITCAIEIQMVYMNAVLCFALWKALGKEIPQAHSYCTVIGLYLGNTSYHTLKNNFPSKLSCHRL